MASGSKDATYPQRAIGHRPGSSAQVYLFLIGPAARTWCLVRATRPATACQTRIIVAPDELVQWLDVVRGFAAGISSCAAVTDVPGICALNCKGVQPVLRTRLVDVPQVVSSPHS